MTQSPQERLRKRLSECRKAAVSNNDGFLRQTIDETTSALDARDAEIARLKSQWQCFHCDEVFTDRARAEEHFGTRQHDAPLCVADQFELTATRKERDEYADIRATVIGKLHERDALLADAERALEPFVATLEGELIFPPQKIEAYRFARATLAKLKAAMQLGEQK